MSSDAAGKRKGKVRKLKHWIANWKRNPMLKYRRLDSFGIKAANVRARIRQLQKEEEDESEGGEKG